jgi:hypothetical protein
MDWRSLIIFRFLCSISIPLFILKTLVLISCLLLIFRNRKPRAELLPVQRWPENEGSHSPRYGGRI